MSNTWSVSLAPEAISEASAPEAISSSARPRLAMTAGARRAVALVLDDLDVAALAGLLEAEEHGPSLSSTTESTRRQISSAKIVQTWHYILRKPLTALNNINALRAQGSVYCSSRVSAGRGSRAPRPRRSAKDDPPARNRRSPEAGAASDQSSKVENVDLCRERNHIRHENSMTTPKGST